MVDFQILSPEAHAELRWRRYDHYLHAKTDAVVPVMLQELPKVATLLPVGFIKHQNMFILTALQNVQIGRNLCVSDEGRWLLKYVPAVYRGYPFALHRDGAGKPAVAVDMASGLIGEEGEPLFVDGKATDAVSSVSAFLWALERDKAKTAQACALLSELGLIRPWSLKAPSDKGDSAISGLFMIDQGRLDELPADALAKLRDSGALLIAYSQVLSMENLSVLGELQAVHVGQADLMQTSPGPLGLTDDGLITF